MTFVVIITLIVFMFKGFRDLIMKLDRLHDIWCDPNLTIPEFPTDISSYDSLLILDKVLLLIFDKTVQKRFLSNSFSN